MSVPVGVGDADSFSKDGGALRPVEYDVLESALSDNPQSMKYLRTHRRLKYASWAAIAGGPGVAGVSVAGVGQGDDLPAGAIVGAGIAALGGWIPLLLRGEQIDSTLKVYNQ